MLFFFFLVSLITSNLRVFPPHSTALIYDLYDLSERRKISELAVMADNAVVMCFKCMFHLHD